MNALALPARAVPYPWEWLKLLALVAMVLDHLAVFFAGGEWSWLRDVGRLAFPIFCLLFGVGLATTRNLLGVVERLALPALVAQLVWIAQGSYYLNVLVVFAFCAAALAATRWNWFWGGLGVVALLPLMALTLEGLVFGPAFVLAGYLWRTRRAVVAPLLVGLVFALALPDGGLWALLGVLLVIGPQPGVVVPRVPGLLLWFYPGHLVLLALLARLLA